MPKQTEQIDTTFMATDIIMQPVSTLIPYANNARTHSDAQIKQIAASIQAFGFTNPVLVDGQNGIIAGHGRILAAELLGITEVPTICLPHLTNTAKRAYVLADNRIAINSGWDMETLAVEVQRIIDDGRYDVGDLGFDAAEVDEMLASIIDGFDGNGADDHPYVSMSDKFMLPPFSVLNAREGAWQARKAEWIALGIKSELGRGGGHNMGSDSGQQANASPGGSPRPACDYRNKQRGDGAGRAIA